MKVEKAVGNMLGIALSVGAAAAVWMWPKPGRVAPPEPTVRPVASVVVKDGFELPDVSFAARVKAANSRTLSFKQSGRIERILVDAGSRVKKGDKLAWLEPHDYENKVTLAEAAAERARLTYERTAEAMKKGGVSREEVSKAQAEMKESAANLAIKRRDLEDTVLYAPFDGIVAKKYAEELEVVDAMSGAKRVLTIQDEADVKIDAAVPETFIIHANSLELRNEKSEGNSYVTFDAAPEVRYPVTFSEFESTSEGKDSQTYTATFQMKHPTDLMLMPGMSATVTLPGANYAVKEEKVKGRFAVPEEAIGAASDGSHFVWVLSPADRPGLFAVAKRVVEIGKAGNGFVFVEKGLAGGERIATAGVTVLTEGRKVTLL